jgi:hypothetical protein
MRVAIYLLIVVEIVAILCAPYFIWLATDRESPLRLYDGVITNYVKYDAEKRVWEVWRHVTWRAHRRRAPLFSDWDCPGLTSRQITDRHHHVQIIGTRERKGVYKPDVDNPYEGTVTTPPLFVGPSLDPGEAEYQITQFYDCNWLQRYLKWPIIEHSPVIKFELFENEVYP